MSQTRAEIYFHRYFIFGKYANGVHVDVADSEGDVVTYVIREEADRLICERNKIIDAFDRVLNFVIDEGLGMGKEELWENISSRMRGGDANHD